MIITIDGPSGVGKSTLSKALARHLGFGQIDSGALYRAVTLHCLRARAPFDDMQALERCALGARVELHHSPHGDVVMLNGDVVDAELRDPEVSRRIANVADLRSVRELVNDVQRHAARGRDLILDGRDCGTVVFPDAEIKVYLTADALSRARRRHEQMLLNKRPQAMQPLAEVVADLEARDARDRARPFGALRQSPDAVVVDTSGLTYEEGWQSLLRAVEEHPAFRARLASTQE